MNDMNDPGPMTQEDHDFRASADRLERAMADMHAGNAARSEWRRRLLHARDPSKEYEREALELWAEGAVEYVRRLLRRSDLRQHERELLTVWHGLCVLHRLLIGMPAHRPSLRHIATTIAGLVGEGAALESSA